MEVRAAVHADLSNDLIRELVESRPEHGQVLTLYLELDPSEFATAEARSSAVTSLIDGAGRDIESVEDLDHDERTGLRDALERAREVLETALGPESDMAAGARALALFAAPATGLFRAVRLHHPVATASAVDEAPWPRPLTNVPHSDWCVLLVNRRAARVFLGGRHTLRELGEIEDDVHGQHDQGGGRELATSAASTRRRVATSSTSRTCFAARSCRGSFAIS